MALDKFQPYLFVSAGEQSNKYLTPVYSDGIASFQAQRAQQVTKLLVQIDPVQEGTGDPSPDNIRPISGRTGLTVTVQSGETQNTYPISWQTEAGEVYGGTLDVASGVLTVTHAGFTISGGAMLYGNYGSDNAPLYYVDLHTWIMQYPTAETKYAKNKLLCNKYTPITVTVVQSMPNAQIRTQITQGETANRLYIRDDRFTTAADLNADLASTPAVVAARLATPQTYQLEPEDVMTLAGYNQIYSDAGPVIDIKF